MKCHLVLNRASRSGMAGRKYAKIFHLLQEEGIEYDCTYAESYQLMKDASAKAQEGNYDAIVAVGGDGTINAVINGFFDDSGALRSGKMMGVIYTGTSPDFCKSYGIPLDLEEAVSILAKPKVRAITLGRIRLAGSPDGKDARIKYFSCCASVGIGAMVAQKANAVRKYLGDTGGTFYAILYSLARFRRIELKIRLSSGERSCQKVTNLFIGRTKYIASGLRVSREIPDSDRRFYILCVRDLNLGRLPGLLAQLYRGDTRQSRVMEVDYSTKMEIETTPISMVEFDGDPAGYTPCSIEVSLYPLKLIVAG